MYRSQQRLRLLSLPPCFSSFSPVHGARTATPAGFDTLQRLRGRTRCFEIAAAEAAQARAEDTFAALPSLPNLPGRARTKPNRSFDAKSSYDYEVTSTRYIILTSSFNKFENKYSF